MGCHFLLHALTLKGTTFPSHPSLFSDFPIKTTLNPGELEILQLNCHLSGMIFLLKIISFNKTEEKGQAAQLPKQKIPTPQELFPQGPYLALPEAPHCVTGAPVVAVILEY